MCKRFQAGLPDCSKAKQPARRKKAAAAMKQASAEASLQPPTAKRYCVQSKSALFRFQAWARCFILCLGYLCNVCCLFGMHLNQAWDLHGRNSRLHGCNSRLHGCNSRSYLILAAVLLCITFHRQPQSKAHILAECSAMYRHVHMTGMPHLVLECHTARLF